MMFKNKFITVIIFTISLILFTTYCTRELSSTSPEIIPTGKIIIDSNPQGAQIFFKGENTGKLTPDSITHLESGSYEIVLKLDLYLDTTLVINIINQAREDIVLDYFAHERNYGTLNCISNPENALIFLNDSSTGLFTPQTIQFLWPGDYEIKYTFPEHRADSTNIQLSAGITNSVSLNLQDTTTWVNYHDGNSGCPVRYTMSCLSIDNNSIKWIGTKDKGLISYNDEKWTSYTMNNSPIPWYRVNCIRIAPDGRKWIGTPQGLAVFDDINWTVYTTSNSGLPNNFINDVTFDSSSNAWIGASDPAGGRFLVKFDGAEWTVIEIDDIISTLAVDNNDNIWLGTANGLIIYRHTEWEDYRNEHSGFFMRSIETIAVEGDNNIWIGAWPATNQPFTPGGLYHFDGNSYLSVLPPTRSISKIVIDNGGNKWIAAGGLYINSFIEPIGGILKLEPSGTFTHYLNSNSNLWDDMLIDIAIQSNGDIWVISRNEGLIKFRGAATQIN